LALTMMFNTSTATSIVIIESHGILREGLRALIELEGDLRVVGEAGTAADGIRAVQSTDPALVITDLTTPGSQGLRIIEQLRAASARVRVLVLTACCSDEYIRAALSAGADGYVLKDAGRTELLQAIRSVIAGQKYFSEPVSARLVSGYLRRREPASGEPAPGPWPRITEREREVLTHVALGESNKHVALALRLSIKTVEKHRANVMRKLELHNTASVTLFAVRNGLVPAEHGERLYADQPLGLPPMVATAVRP
jgi:two-component system, NarL family, response regulator NreC